MSRRLLLTHLAVALIVLALARSAPGLNLLILVVVVLGAAWVMAGAALTPMHQGLSALSAWARMSDQATPPALSGDFTNLVEALTAARDRFTEGLSELVADKHRAELILNNMRDGVVLTEPDGPVILVNPAAAAIFRRPAEEIVGRPLIYSVHSQEFDRLIDKVITGGREAEAQIDIFMPRERHLLVLALPVNDGKRLSAVLTVWQDVTARQRVDAVRRAFIANVSHELKTPVAGINLLADSLAASVGVDDKAAKRFAAKLASEARLLSQLISDLLDLSQLEASEVKSVFAPVSLSAIVKKTVSAFMETAAAKGISLRTDLARGLPSVNGNQDQLRLMARNLVENAIHYTPTGGDVLVTTTATDDSVTLEVIDSGIGIPTADRRRIFERFYRVDKARSRETGGTGLGLSIVKHVVDNHNGKIKLKSTVGVGSTFTVVLPAKVRGGAKSEIASLRSQ